MKKITIELSDDQFLKMEEHLKKGKNLNLEHETFSGFALHLNSCEIEDWLEIEMYGTLDLGAVHWKIE